MIFSQTPLQGAYVVELAPHHDERGLFARTWCQREFAEQGLDPHLVQCSISFNQKKGTVRGMHWQLPPFAEAKLVRCTSGAVYDVIIDLRPDSQTYTRWFGVELTAVNRKALYVPPGFAHGLQTLADDTELFYQISQFYAPELARGVRWNDPCFHIVWPLPVSVISAKDQSYADFDSVKD